MEWGCTEHHKSTKRYHLKKQDFNWVHDISILLSSPIRKLYPRVFSEGLTLQRKMRNQRIFILNDYRNRIKLNFTIEEIICQLIFSSELYTVLKLKNFRYFLAYRSYFNIDFRGNDVDVQNKCISSTYRQSKPILSSVRSAFRFLT